MRILTRADIEQLLEMREVIALMRQLFTEMGGGSVTMLQRSVISLRDGKDTVLFMPAYVGGMNRVGVKVVSVFPDNPVQFSRSTINATILLNDPSTGEIAAVMDGGYITALRTGAVSAVATDLLAVPAAHRLGVFGAGVQAESHIDAIMAVRPIALVRVYDPDPARSARLVDRLAGMHTNGCEFRVARTPEESAADVDIVVTATTSRTPVFDGRSLAPGTHVNAIGAFRPEDRELDDETMARARIFVDSRLEAMAEAGDLIIPLKAGHIRESAIESDLGELVVSGPKRPRAPADVTVFKSVGLAVEDIVVAGYVYEKAQSAHVGTTA